MRRAAGSSLPEYPLPGGYRFVLYADGDEADWARIETSVLEFETEFKALMYFTQKFLPFREELRRRCIFIEDSAGVKIANTMAWWSVVGEERRPWLHWVAVVPGHQGLGLGKAIVSRAVSLMKELEGDCDYYLSTQTWSHKAIEIYKLHGFEPTSEKILYKSKGDNYKKALRILRRIAIQLASLG